MNNIANYVRWAIIRWLLQPKGIRLIGSNLVRCNVGEFVILRRPPPGVKVSHDALSAFHCNDYSILFYAPIEEFKP